MSVWLCMPSKRAPVDAQPVIDAWRDSGYKVIVQRDIGDPPLHGCMCIHRKYAGYPEAANYLIHSVMAMDNEAEWFVCAGDDILPDPLKSADEIGEECNRYFSDEVLPHWKKHMLPSATFGVMQPTGDRWGVGERSNKAEAHIDCIAGSPWIGREYARRMYGGKGPYFPEYYHMFDDEEMQCVAQLMGVFWQRRDITHLHKHWARAEKGKYGRAEDMPAFLKYANSGENWNKSKELFLRRKLWSFPGHEPIP